MNYPLKLSSNLLFFKEMVLDFSYGKETGRQEKTITFPASLAEQAATRKKPCLEYQDLHMK